ncbi:MULTISPECIES: phosphonate ABC transporter ATP-binding protein [Hydrogenophaga]|uniref:phosphonate ABC transporter ATP-binding protein n=1 Tax=Hydrogenophaga TaxID=47420 RepID=UPI000773AC36|nr:MULTISPECIES: ATP-binding cassette domain-containing protein [Hydrogenophaga]AOS81744.1 phosphonate ABC transporter [Hydrogenophaga sp. PBC]TMU70742.1 ATP-binding cassette domain-containing protein [Hydrogenophaga intermedia]
MEIALEHVSARHAAARAAQAPALQGLSLRVAAGEHVAVIGPSGAGKTTLLQLMACAMPPSAGQVQLDGASPWSLPRADLQRLRARLLLAPQVPPLPPRQRVVTAVLAARLPSMGLWASLRSLLRPSDIPAAFAALERFDLGDKLFERVDRLSGGERQRVGLARALLAPATAWLVDEPLSALDPTRARQAIHTLIGGAREHRATLVATLHQVDVALAHFPRIVGLRDGQLAFDLPAAEVSSERLATLYDQFEHELQGTPASPPPPMATPLPPVLMCR